MFVSA